MILKLIHCELPLTSKPAFSCSQRKWASISKIPGFLLQFGGYTTIESSNRAVIIGFWENRRDYKTFMSKYHDEIYIKSGQKQTYNSCKVQVFSVNCFEPILSSSLLQSLSKSIEVGIRINKNNIIITPHEGLSDSLKLAIQPKDIEPAQAESIFVKIEPTWTVIKN